MRNRLKKSPLTPLLQRGDDFLSPFEKGGTGGFLAVVVLILALVVLFPAKTFAAKSGYDWGFFIASDDDEYKLVLTGGVLPRFRYKHQKTTNDYTSFSLGAYTTFKTEIQKKGKMEITLGHGTGSPEYTDVQMGNAIAEWNFRPEFAMTIGTVGLGLDLGCDYGWLLLTEPPITRTQGDGVNDGVPEGRVTPLRSSFGAPGGLGLRFSGYVFDRVYYSASVINGNENNFLTNPNLQFSAGGRLRFDILGHVSMDKETDYDYTETPALSVGAGSIYQGKRTDPNTQARIKYWWTSSMGAGLRYKGLAITAEGYYRRTRILSIGNATWARPMLIDIGYYVATGYYVIPKKLELAAIAAQIIRQGPDNNSYEFGGGINYYIAGFNSKLQLAYARVTDFDDITGVENNNIHILDLQFSQRF